MSTRAYAWEIQEQWWSLELDAPGAARTRKEQEARKKRGAGSAGPPKTRTPWIPGRRS